MPAPRPEHLLDQGAQLAAPPGQGAPRQVNLRRAVSAAYYAVFHHTLIAAADQVEGVAQRNTTHYALVYRAIDHSTLRDVCDEVRKQTPGSRYRRYVPTGGFDAALRAFALSVLDLRERRHAADYDPLLRLRTSDAAEAVALAREAIRSFDAADPTHRRTFLSLLLFPPR